MFLPYARGCNNWWWSVKTSGLEKKKQKKQAKTVRNILLTVKTVEMKKKWKKITILLVKIEKSLFCMGIFLLREKNLNSKSSYDKIVSISFLLDFTLHCASRTYPFSLKITRTSGENFYFKRNKNAKSCSFSLTIEMS